VEARAHPGQAMSPRQHGTGSLTVRNTKRDGEVYYAQFRKGGKKVARRLGPVRQPGSKTGLTPTQANTALARMIADYEPPVIPDEGTGIRFPEARRAYVKSLKRAGRKKATLVAVESCFKVWLEPHFGNKPLDRVTPDDIEALVSSMEVKGLAAKSVQNYIGTLSAVYRHGMRPRVEWVTANPCEGADLPAVADHDEIRFLTPEQVDALIRAVPDMTGEYPNVYAELDRVLYRVAAMTGLRQGELIALRWGDIDWPVSRLRVRRSYVLGEMGTPKSRRSSRAVPMGLEVQKVLAAWQPHDATDTDLVFADPISAGPLSKRTILQRFRRALKLAGLPPERRFHDLRHTFGTCMAAAGVSLRSLQEYMGHRDLATTQIYADYAPGERESEMVDAAFARPEIPDPVKEPR
jgi:integrase